MSTSRKVTLKSSDGEAIEVDEAVALESQMIKHIIKDDCADSEILLPEVTSKILSKVIEYCKKHVGSPKSDDCATGAVDDDLKAWDAAFVKVDKDTLFDLILAAKYLNIKSLLDLTCRTVLDFTEGKTVEEMSKWYIEVDPENQWPSGKRKKSRRMSTSMKITLKSSDGEAIEVDKAVALESQMIKHIIKDDCADNEILLPEVTSKILSKVIEYCKKHVESPKSDDCATGAVDDDLKAWDATFVKVDKDTLFDLILAAKYLNIKSLLDLTCRTVLDLTEGKTVEEMNKWYIEVDPENQWPSGKRKKSRRMSMSRKITLKSSDGEAIEVDKAVALESQMIKHIIKDDCADNEILLPEVTSKILSKVIKYCKKHVESPKSDDCATGAVDDDLKAWDAAFVKVDKDTLFDLILAAKYLNIKSLLDLTCRTVLDFTEGKTVGEMNKWYIEVDPENQWPSGKRKKLRRMSTSMKITLKSSDGEAIEVDKAVALESQMIKHIIKDDCADNEILLPEVTSKILSKVIEYCKKHVESPKSDDCATGAVDDDLKAWDATFVKVDKDTLFDLILAAKYLNIKSLLDLTCRTVLDLTEGKTVEEMNKWYIEVDP